MRLVLRLGEWRGLLWWSWVSSGLREEPDGMLRWVRGSGGSGSCQYFILTEPSHVCPVHFPTDSCLLDGSHSRRIRRSSVL